MFIQGIIRGSDKYWIELVSPWELNDSEDQNLLYDNIFVFYMRILYSKSYFFITQWDRSISYKILLWMWLRENLVLKSLKYVNTSPQQTHLHLFQGATVMYYRA